MKQLIFLFIVSSSIFGATYQTMTELGSSASMIGLGNIHGFEKSANVIFDNPAGLNNINGISAGSFYTELMDGEIEFRNLSLGIKTHVGSFAIGLMESAVLDIPQTAIQDDEYVQVGSFGYKNQLAKLGYAFKLNHRVTVGANLVGINHEIGTVNAQTMNTDLGALIEVDRLNLSVVLQNALFFQDLNYSNGGAEDIPTTVIGGLKVGLLDNLDGYFQLKTFLREEHQLMSLGVAYQPNIVGRLLTIRVGWKEFLILDEKHSSATVGIGLDLINIGFDVAYEKSSYFEVDSKQYVSFRFNF